MSRHHTTPTGNIPFTAEEETQKDVEEQAWNDKSAERKLAEIKRIRLEKLQETDYLGVDDQTMTDAIKTYRQELRDIPQNHTNEAAYALLLAREPDRTKANGGQLTHSIWVKP